MRSTDKVIAIAVADLHLCHKPPLARSNEPDWYDAMRRPLRELSCLQDKYACPIFVSGDVFDKWQVPPELIYFALDELPEDCFVIPGQHDLPYHSYDALWKSGLGILIKANKVALLSAETMDFVDFGVTGFAWNQPICPPTVVDVPLQFALVHAYCWRRGKGYHGASDDCNVAAFKKQLEGYDLALFGDNHVPFEAKAGDCVVFNCGGFMRRKTDEVDLRPSCGLIFQSGKVERYFFDTTKDVLSVSSAIKQAEATDEEISAFVKSLGNHPLNDPLDFEAQLRHAADEQTSGSVQEVLRELIDAHYRQ